MRRPLLRHSFILFLLAALAGCHSAKVLIPPNLRPPSDTGNGLAEARKHLDEATPCCSSFADFSYANVLPPRPKRFTIGVGSPVVNLNGTRSHYLAFRLPEDAKLPYQIALKSELTSRWLHSSYIFAPTLVVLDGGFQPIDSTDVGLCEYMGWSADSTGAYGRASVDSPKARYLVVYSSGKQQSADTYWEQSPAAFSAEAPVQMTSTGSFRVPHGPDGQLWVGMMDKDFHKAIKSGICDKAAPGNGVLNTLRGALPTFWLGGEH